MSKTKQKSITGTKEWAKYNYNIQSGCDGRACKYCFGSAMAIRFGRKTPETWSKPEINMKAVNKKWKKMDGVVMMPSAHDITGGNISHCLTTLDNMLKVGNKVLIVSKPDPHCIKTLCDNLGKYKSQVLFRFTIGSVDDRVLKFWEPGAPSFGNRIKALAHAYVRGFKTSVSIEPILDYYPEKVIKIVDEYVTDTIWLGLMNNAKARLKLNGAGDDALMEYDGLRKRWCDDNVKFYYNLLKDNPKVRWKDSIKKIVGIDAPQEAGLDV